MYSIENLLKLLEHERLQHSVTVDKGRIIPYMVDDQINVKPGELSEDLYSFSELFPTVFYERTFFLGSLAMDHTNVFWSKVKDKVYESYGEFNPEGEFLAPMTVHSCIHGDSLAGYMMFQLGNAQEVPSFQKEYIQNGDLKIFRCIGNSRTHRQKRIPEDGKEDYYNLICATFLRYESILAYASNGISSTNHIRPVGFANLFRALGISRNKGQLLQNVHEVSYTSDKDLVMSKFGPNYVSMITPLNNLRIFPSYSREGELHLINPQKIKDLKFHFSV